MNQRQPAELSPWLYYLVLPIFVLLLALSGEPLHALGLPEITVQHLQDLLFTAQQPLTLEARLSDSAGIIAARCYFRYLPGGDYVYAEMERTGDDYRVTLPAPAERVGEVEYFFLAVNGARQVVRTDAYTLHRSGQGNVAATESEQQVLEIRTEGVLPDDFADVLADPGRVRVESVPADECFGLIAGVYEAVAFPGSAFVRGYFGGFRLDAGGTLLPVKGLIVHVPSVSRLSMTAATAAPEESVAETAIVGPDIAGNWKGVIYIDDDGVHSYARPLTAVITQDGSAVTIVTSQSLRPQRLVGTIDEQGHMLLYDEYHEDWTTYYGPATSTELTIADFMYPPSPDDPLPPLLVVELKKTLPPPPPPPNISFLPAVFHLLLPGAKQ